VYGNRWGVNLLDFPYINRKKADRFVFVNGNGGYKLRKASDIVFNAFSRSGAPPLIVYTQKNNIAEVTGSNITLINKNFPTRNEVYSEGDVFLFPSYWEGLCHGIYEGQASGGVVITSDHPPMNECGTPFLVPIESYMQEDLSGKKICKAIPSSDTLYSICKKLYKKDISDLSTESRRNIETNFNLEATLTGIYTHIIIDAKSRV
jgi:glycosyltransferase involved in cell wall biosynthesis